MKILSEKQIFYLGKLEEFAEDKDNGDLLKDAEMFSVGKHRGTEYTQEDLDELVKNFKAEDSIPVQLDHSTSARDTVGFIDKVEAKDGKLLGKLRIVDEYAKERIKLGLMNKLSIGFYLKETEEGFKPHALREVSLVAFPQVKSARLFSENGYVTDYEEGGTEMTEGKDLKVNLSELKAEIKAEMEAELTEQYSALQTEVEVLRGVKKEFNEVQISSKVEKFSAESKVVPAQADALKTLLASFSAEQMTAFEEFMSNSQKVDFSEHAEHNQEEHPNDKKKEELSEDEKFYLEHSEKYGKTL